MQCVKSINLVGVDNGNAKYYKQNGHAVHLSLRNAYCLTLVLIE